MKYVFLTHHKCGYMWSTRVMNALQWAWRPSDTIPLFSTNSAFVSNEQTAEALKNSYIIDANVTMKMMDLLSWHNYRGVHVTRDPKDLIVSAYFSHLHSHSTSDWEELVGHREKLKEMSEEDGLIATIDFLDFVWDSYRTWEPVKAVMEVAFEEMIEQPVEVWSKIVDWYGWELNDQEVSSIVNSFSFKTITGRERGTEVVDHHMRKGVPGDWKNHFTPRVEQHFKEHLSDIARKEDC